MSKLLTAFPRLSLQHLKECAEVIVRERNTVATLTTGVWDEINLGLACAIMGCQVVRGKLEQLAFRQAGAGAPWLKFHRGQGLAFTLVIDGVPMRVQPDIPEIRDILPEERTALLECAAGQESLFPNDATEIGVLRLEVAQLQRQPVKSVTLFFFNNRTGEQLDSITVYDGDTGAYFGTLPHALPPQEVDGGELFRFDTANDVTETEDGE